MGLSRKSIFLNLFWSSAGYITGVVRTLFLIPVFLSNWDSGLFGFWLLILNFYSMSVYVVEGYSRYSINEYSKLFFKDPESAYKYFGNSLRVLVFLSVICCLLLGIILQFAGPVEKLFHVNEAVVSYHSLGAALFIIFLLVCIHSIAKFLGYAVIPHGKIYVPERFIAIYVLAETAIWLIAALGILSLFQSIVLYCVVLSGFSIGFVILLLRKHHYYKEIFTAGKLKEGLTTALRPVSYIVNNFCEKFTVEGLSFIVASLYTSFMVPLYSATRTLTNLMVTGTNMIVSTFTIEYQKHSVKKDGMSLLNLFNATWLLVGFIVNYGTVIFYPFLPSIFNLWTKNKLSFDQDFFNYLLATSLFIVYGSNIITYLKSTNRVKQVFVVAVARAALLLSLILVFPKQLPYIGLSLLITEFVINAVLLNIFLYYELSRMQSGQIVGKIFWNLLPFGITSLYIITNDLFELETYMKMTITLVIITVGYFIQIMKVDNEALVVRLQIIKYKLFGGKQKS